MGTALIQGSSEDWGDPQYSNVQKPLHLAVIMLPEFLPEAFYARALLRQMTRLANCGAADCFYLQQSPFHCPFMG